MTTEKIEISIETYNRLVADHTRINFFAGLGNGEGCTIVRHGNKFCIAGRDFNILSKGSSVREVIDIAMGVEPEKPTNAEIQAALKEAMDACVMPIPRCTCDWYGEPK